MSETGDAAERLRPSANRLPLVQKRSRERQEKILSIATQRIAEAGSDAMTMSDIAKRSGISIGSLYQHFRDKSAILAAIAERYHQATRDCIDTSFERVSTAKEFSAAFTQLLDVYYDLFLSEPVIRDVWSGVAADRTLLSLEIENSRKNGDSLANHLRRISPKADPEALRAASFLVMSLGEAVMRLAILLPEEEGRRHVNRYRDMALAELRRAAA